MAVCPFTVFRFFCVGLQMTLRREIGTAAVARTAAILDPSFAAFHTAATSLSKKRSVPSATSTTPPFNVAPASVETAAFTRETEVIHKISADSEKKDVRFYSNCSKHFKVVAMLTTCRSSTNIIRAAVSILMSAAGSSVPAPVRRRTKTKTNEICIISRIFDTSPTNTCVSHKRHHATSLMTSYDVIEYFDIRLVWQSPAFISHFTSLFFDRQRATRLLLYKNRNSGPRQQQTDCMHNANEAHSCCCTIAPSRE
jgi:hypothetical protein